VSPEVPSGADAISHVLRRLDEIARELLSTFSTDALLRTAPEMERMRELAQEAGAIDEGWDEASAKYRDDEGNVRDEDLRRYDELRFDFALEAWEVSSTLATIDGL
jgi:hypothetical protein